MRYNTNIITLLTFVAALLISGCGGTNNGKGGGGSKDETFIAKKAKEFASAWEAVTIFDKKLYDSQMDDVHRWENNKRIKHGEAETLRGTIRGNAIQTAYKGYNDALANWCDSSETLMKQNFGGLCKIKKDFGLTNNTKISEIGKVDTLFNDAMGFVRGDIKIPPNFNQRTFRWSSFNSQKKIYTDKAELLQNSPYYSRISHVPEIKEGLVENLEYKLENKRYGYYENLVTQIIKCFENRKPLSKDDQDALDIVFNQLDNEASSHTSRLAQFMENNKTAN